VTRRTCRHCPEPITQVYDTTEGYIWQHTNGLRDCKVKLTSAEPDLRIMVTLEADTSDWTEL
jgi:hypothetical protein